MVWLLLPSFSPAASVLRRQRDEGLPIQHVIWGCHHGGRIGGPATDMVATIAWAALAAAGSKDASMGANGGGRRHGVVKRDVGMFPLADKWRVWLLRFYSRLIERHKRCKFASPSTLFYIYSKSGVKIYIYIICWSTVLGVNDIKISYLDIEIIYSRCSYAHILFYIIYANRGFTWFKHATNLYIGCAG